MLSFSKYFSKSLHNTLKNSVNFSYKPHWAIAYSNTVIDQWHVGEFMAAEYTIVVDAGTANKEIIKCLVVAGVNSAQLTVYGRTNLGSDLIEISAQVDASILKLIVNPVTLNGKVIFSANYYQTINELEP